MDIQERVFDKKSIKLLRYIYRRDGVTEEKIRRKFGDITLTLVGYSIDLYLLPKDENGDFFVYSKDDGRDMKPTTRWYTTPRAKAIVEKASFEFWKWLAPLVFSALSLLISSINIILNFISR